MVKNWPTLLWLKWYEWIESSDDSSIPRNFQCEYLWDPKYVVSLNGDLMMSYEACGEVNTVQHFDSGLVYKQYILQHFQCWALIGIQSR